MRLSFVPVVVALLPLAAIHLCYLLAAYLGHVPWCLPYVDSCTSISAAGRAKAVTAWEAENGPLGDREPFFIERCFVSPPARREAEAAAPVPQEPETNVTPFLAR